MTHVQTAAGIVDGAQQVHRIDVREVAHGIRGPLYAVHLGDELLIAKAREPLFAACRILADRGMTGILELWRRGATGPAMRVDIAKGAGLTTSDPDAGRPKFAKWVPRETPGSEAD